MNRIKLAPVMISSSTKLSSTPNTGLTLTAMTALWGHRTNGTPFGYMAIFTRQSATSNIVSISIFNHFFEKNDDIARKGKGVWPKR